MYLISMFFKVPQWNQTFSGTVSGACTFESVGLSPVQPVEVYFWAEHGKANDAFISTG